MHSLVRGRLIANLCQAASIPTQGPPSSPAFQKLVLHQAPCSCLLYLWHQPGLEEHQHLSHHGMSCSTSWRALELSTQNVDREREWGRKEGRCCAVPILGAATCCLKGYLFSWLVSSVLLSIACSKKEPAAPFQGSIEVPSATRALKALAGNSAFP